MEVILGLIGTVLAILFIVYVVLPVLGIILVVTTAAGGCYALFVSTVSFFGSLVEHINPYTTYVDNGRHASYGRRGYFFGPGFHQIAVTVSGAFARQQQYIERIKGDGTLTGFMAFLHGVFFYSAAVFIYLFGSAFVCVYSALLFLVIFSGMCLFFLFFSLLWTADRLFLLLHAVTCRCPSCKRLCVIPIFLCPDCGTEHAGLTPGPYGVFHRKCACGHRLPTTVFNGRSGLGCVCPFCGTPLAHSTARQFGVQLVGSTSVGKTAYLTAFWHLFLERLQNDPELSVQFFPQEAFDDLEIWYQDGCTAATNEKNANMYSAILSREGRTPYQFTLYDVAGESFTELDANEQQQQFRYCEALIVVLDPEDPHGAEACISGFVEEFGKLRKMRASRLASLPVAVVISKGDLYKREIGLPKIRIQANAILTAARSGQEQPSSDTVMDEESALFMARTDLCRGFLRRRGFDNTLNLLEGTFRSLAFFPASAMGHAAGTGLAYAPWGVLEPMRWIISQDAGEELALYLDVQGSGTT